MRGLISVPDDMRGERLGRLPGILRRRGRGDCADRRASARLDQVLKHGCEPVACPDCGTYQFDMVQVLTRRRGAGYESRGLSVCLAEPRGPPFAAWWNNLSMEAYLGAFRPPAGVCRGAGCASLDCARSGLLRIGYHPVGEPRLASVPPPAGSYGPFRPAEFERKRAEVKARQERWGDPDHLNLAMAADFGKRRPG